MKLSSLNQLVNVKYPVSDNASEIMLKSSEMVQALTFDSHHSWGPLFASPH